MIYFFILFLSISAHSMELENLNDYSLPPRISEIESFKESKLERYLDYYVSQKKEGHHYWSGILKEEYEEEIKNISIPFRYMLDFWFVDEILNLEKCRRQNLLGSFPLINFLRNPGLIPENIRDLIEFPSFPSQEHSLLKKDSQKEGFFRKFMNFDFEVKEYY